MLWLSIFEMCEKEMEQERDVTTTVKTSSREKRNVGYVQTECVFLALAICFFISSFCTEKEKYVLAESWVLSSLDSLNTDDVCVLNVRKTLKVQQIGPLGIYSQPSGRSSVKEKSQS